MAKEQNTLNNIQTGMGVASPFINAIPGAGQAISAGLSLGSQVLSWILGSKKTDWNKWRQEQQAGINAQYNTSLSNAKESATHIADATIAQAANQQGLAGAVSGVTSPGRLNASVYSQVAQQRDKGIMNITNALEQNRAAMLSSIEREAAQREAQENANAPTTLDYVNNFIGTLQVPAVQEGIGMMAGGIGKGVQSVINFLDKRPTNSAILPQNDFENIRKSFNYKEDFSVPPTGPLNDFYSWRLKNLPVPKLWR